MSNHYDVMQDVTGRGYDVLPVDQVPGGTQARVCTGDKAILVRKAMTTPTLLAAVARAVAHAEIAEHGGGMADDMAVARLYSSRLVPLDALAVGLAIHDGGIEATARDLYVPPSVVNERLQTLTPRERAQVSNRARRYRWNCGGSTCPCTRRRLVLSNA
jgi:hypothetical protein